MDDKELYQHLKAWFKKNWGKKHTFCRNEIARLIRSELEATGHFKAAPRGNPRKGKRESDKAKARKNGWIENNDYDY